MTRVREAACLGVAFFLLVTHSLLCAQERATRPLPPGTVTGHVFCGDTQRPARLARVALVAVPTPGAPSGKPEQETEIGSSPATDYVETTLDGSFTLTNVKPGVYYIIVDKDGYLLPLAEFSPSDLKSASKEEKARLASRLQSVMVGSAQVVDREITLERGGAVAGSVTYDDGSPAGELEIAVLTKGADGKWEKGIAQRYRSFFGRIHTDDRGHYRVAGLPPGDYLIEADLTLNEYTTTTTPASSPGGDASVMRMQRSKYSLPIFSGNVWRSKGATAFALGSGEERSGVDLEFPLSKLHQVTGQVLAKDGHAVNGGKATLMNADDQSKVTDTEINFDDSKFHLEFVPEGEFTLKVSGAKDVRKVQVANAPGSVPRFHDETKTVRSFGDSQQTIKVLGETTGVVLQVGEAAKTAVGSVAHDSE